MIPAAPAVKLHSNWTRTTASITTTRPMPVSWSCWRPARPTMLHRSPSPTRRSSRTRLCWPTSWKVSPMWMTAWPLLGRSPIPCAPRPGPTIRLSRLSWRPRRRGSWACSTASAWSTPIAARPASGTIRSCPATRARTILWMRTRLCAGPRWSWASISSTCPRSWRGWWPRWTPSTPVVPMRAPAIRVSRWIPAAWRTAPRSIWPGPRSTSWPATTAWSLRSISCRWAGGARGTTRPAIPPIPMWKICSYRSPVCSTG